MKLKMAEKYVVYPREVLSIRKKSEVLSFSVLNSHKSIKLSSVINLFNI